MRSAAEKGAAGAAADWPLVSVGLPTYNRADTLRRAIESALVQDYPNVELVVCDNASADGTQALCEEYRRRDPRVRYVRQETNVGPNGNFRRALAESRGEFFMWLGDDDWMDSTYVSRCMEVLLAHPDHQIVSGKGRYYLGGEFILDEDEMNLPEESATERVVSYYRRVTANCAFYGVMPRATAAELMIDDVLAGDWLFVARVAFRGKLRTVPGACIRRSVSGASQDAESLAEHHGLAGFGKRHVYLLIALSVFKDIAWRSPVFSTLGKPARWLLALRSAAPVVSRHCLPPWLRKLRAGWNNLRARLILRTRLRLFAQRYLNRQH